MQQIHIRGGTRLWNGERENPLKPVIEKIDEFKQRRFTKKDVTVEDILLKDILTSAKIGTRNIYIYW